METVLLEAAGEYPDHLHDGFRLLGEAYAEFQRDGRCADGTDRHGK